MNGMVTKLRVRDEDFLVNSMIERCPPTMMIRELLQNAIEASAALPEDQRLVEFSAHLADGVPKLAIWNTGIGLTGPELYRMCDIASSLRKETGLDQNFGMGAKVASLPSNKRGMRYRSARKGTIQEVVIGKFDGIYGRLRRPKPDGQMTEVLVVPSSEAEGRDPRVEWIEVVLLGNSAEQNTVLNPYGVARPDPRWLLDAIGLRFFRFPPSSRIVLQAGVAGLKEPRQLVSTADRLAALEHYEAVKAPGGITIHYAYDPEPAPHSGAVAALVHRDEMYSVLSRQSWWREAGSFGITFLARHVSILVELPCDFPVQAEAYREFLRFSDGKNQQVRLLDFASLVVAQQPAWLARLMRDAAPSAAYLDDVQEEMAALLAELGVARQRPRQQRAANDAPAPAATADAPPAEPRPQQTETPPQMLLLREQAEIEDRGLKHRAALFYPETHQLHVNLLYPAVGELAKLLTDRAPPGLDATQVTLAAQMVAERSMVLRVARFLAHALAKRSMRREWREGHLRAALSPEALTLAADDIRSTRLEAEAAMAAALAGNAKPA